MVVRGYLKHAGVKRCFEEPSRNVIWNQTRDQLTE